MSAMEEANSGSGQALSPGISSKIVSTEVARLSEDHQNVVGKTRRKVVLSCVT